MNNRQIFVNFLKPKFEGEKLSEIIAKFDIFFEQLCEINSQINLFSRQTNLDDLWTIHFLDSLLIMDTGVNFDGKKICDFGTGGGLPGIPLAIVNPGTQIFMLDSKQKKLSAIEKICEKIGLKNCAVIHSRIEDIPSKYNNFFDILTCRSVKILPEFVKPMQKIVTKCGKIYLYKSVVLDDTEHFSNKKFIDVSREEIGKRIIVEIS
jgi:16S rRNA (guanine527-N7)-methyltransferase